MGRRNEKIFFQRGHADGQQTPKIRNINNHAGTLEKYDDGNVRFSYIDDGKIIQIESPDEATINEILK